jgi:hypothetical protein
MAAGNQPTQASINSVAGMYAIALRDAFQKVKFFGQWLSAQPGGAQAFLVGLGFAAGDAAVIVSTYANLAALEAVYEGGAPGAALNYQQNSNLLWGGQ